MQLDSFDNRSSTSLSSSSSAAASKKRKWEALSDTLSDMVKVGEKLVESLTQSSGGNAGVQDIAAKLNNIDTVIAHLKELTGEEVEEKIINLQTKKRNILLNFQLGE